MTTAAELRAAAETMLELQRADNDKESAKQTREKRFPGMSASEAQETVQRGLFAMARHVLATVHADDDEPVTEEWLPSIPNGSFKPITKVGELPKTFWCCREGVVINFVDRRMSVAGRAIQWKSRGGMRRLLAELSTGEAIPYLQPFVPIGGAADAR